MNSNTQSIYSTDSVCSICSRNLGFFYTTLECDKYHSYHTKCLAEWLENNEGHCPVCCDTQEQYDSSTSQPETIFSLILTVLFFKPDLLLCFV